MIQKMYTVYDRKAETHLPPFCMPTRAAAIRAFVSSKSGDTDLAKYPDDFMLVEHGDWDSATGEFKRVSGEKWILMLGDIADD